MPHPLEQLRYVARGWSSGDEFPAPEVAAVLAELAELSPNMLLQSCRRMIEYFPGSGAAWWLSARALTAADPAQAVWQAADELLEDPTAQNLAQALPKGASIAVSPMSSVVRAALRRRKDVRTERKLGPAQLLVVPVQAAGPPGALVSQRAARAVHAAAGAGKTAWAIVGRGSVLPAPLWERLLALATPSDEMEVVGAAAWAGAVGDSGFGPTSEAFSRATCPPAAELLGWKL